MGGSNTIEMSWLEESWGTFRDTPSLLQALAALSRQCLGVISQELSTSHRVGRNVFTRKRTTTGKILPSLSPPCEDVSSSAV